jgi:hypothetical protein
LGCVLVTPNAVVMPRQKEGSMFGIIKDDNGDFLGYEDESTERAVRSICGEKTFTAKEVLEIVDSCFHCYASSYRSDAREYAKTIISKRG